MRRFCFSLVKSRTIVLDAGTASSLYLYVYLQEIRDNDAVANRVEHAKVSTVSNRLGC